MMFVMGLLTMLWMMLLVMLLVTNLAEATMTSRWFYVNLAFQFARRISIFDLYIALLLNSNQMCLVTTITMTMLTMTLSGMTEETTEESSYSSALFLLSMLILAMCLFDCLVLFLDRLSLLFSKMCLGL